MKHNYKDFELDFDKADCNIIAQAIDKLYPEGVENTVCPDDISWNILGNYVMYFNQDSTCYYFTKNYLNVSGWDLYNQNEINDCFNYLRQFKVINQPKR